MKPKQFHISRIQIFFLISLFISSAANASTRDDDIEKLFDWAQSKYTVYFDSPASTQTLDVWRYRYYPNTGVYLGVNDLNEVHVLGKPFGGLVSVGMLNDFLSLVPENFVYTQKLAAIGMPAAGFPENYIYYDVSNPGMGPNGDIAFSGGADDKIHSTDASRTAVWTGRPGNFKVIIRENDAIPGLPNNILFDEVISDSLTVTQSGYVAFVARLKGAVNTQNDEVILAYVNGEVKVVLREGDPAPDFPIGTVIMSLVNAEQNFSFSDAGLVISGVANGIQSALWFWDFNKVKLLVADVRTNPLNEVLEFPNKACFLGLFFTPLINNKGDIVVSSTLLKPDGLEDCTIFSFKTLLKINGSSVSISLDSNIQLFKNDNFEKNTSSFAQYDLNTAGGISFNNSGRTDSISITGTWYRPDNGDFQIVSLSEETLPDDFTTFFFQQDVIVNENADAVVYASDRSISFPKGADYILSGKPRPSNFYTSPDQAAQSHLSLVAKTGMQPPGLKPTDFFKTIAAPVITSKGDIIFAASVESALGSSGYHPSLWRAKPDGTLYRLVYDGQPTKFGNKDEEISFSPQYDKTAPFRGIGNGQPNQYSNTGKIVFQGLRSNSRPIYQTSYYD